MELASEAKMEGGTSREVEEDEEEVGGGGGGTGKEQQVWSWGAGTEGQLGTGKLQDEHTPRLLSSLSSFGTISLLSCGGAHVIALTLDGKVVTWGRGTSGQLGHGDMLNRSQPEIVKVLEEFIITNVSAGWNHSGFVSEEGSLFTCGDGLFGQLGHGDYNTRSSPELVSCFNSLRVCEVACGMRHSLALVQGQLCNKVYSFGSGKRGQLGVSSEKVRSVNLPQICLGLLDVKIVSIYANGDHSAALSDEGDLYTWGKGFRGTRDVHIPRLSPNLRFLQAALGWNHALLLAENGDVLMLGSYGNGILKSSTTEEQAEVLSSFEQSEALQNVHELSGFKVLQIAAGAEHSALVTDDGSIMTWGWGEHGQLGHRDTLDQATPKVAFCSRKSGNQHISIKVFCGSGFTFCCKDSTFGLNSTNH